ncbi:transposable element Tcb1 transposase [Trichonephila clavipes]|nr:transposable element Tcb1 transposase [Trichonephila clavipes]
MTIGDITEEKWQIALATQNSNTVEELIDRATALDAICSAKQEHKKHHSPKPQTLNLFIHMMNSVFFTSSSRSSTIAQPRNTSQQNQYSNSQTRAQIPSSSSSTSSNNNTLFETTSLNYSNYCRKNNNRNSISGRFRTANTTNNHSKNCIRTQTNWRALIPVIKLLATVVFTDVSRICLQPHDGRIRVWRHRGEKRLNSYVMHHYTGPAPGIMVWYWISLSHSSNTHCRYFKQPALHFRGVESSCPSLSLGLGQAIFQQGNARTHVVRIVQRFFVNHQIELFPWSVRSPDLSPIENMWSMVAE